MKHNWQTVGAIVAIIISIGSLTFNFVGENAVKAEQLQSAREKLEKQQSEIEKLKEPNPVLVQRITDIQKELERKEIHIKTLTELKSENARSETQIASLRSSMDKITDGFNRLERTQVGYATEQAKVSVVLQTLVESNNDVANALRDLHGYASKQEVEMARMDQRLSQIEKRDRKDGY